MLCFSKSTIRSYMEYCCHVRAGAHSCYLELLDKLQKWICRTVGPSLTTSRELLADRRNVASLSLFYRYYFGTWHLYWLNRFHFFILEGGLLVILIDWLIFILVYDICIGSTDSLPYSRGRSTCFCDRLTDFSVTIPPFLSSFLSLSLLQALTRSKDWYSF